MPAETCAVPGEPDEPALPRLQGDFAIWLLILAELLTFGLLFVSFALARWREPAVFAAGQATLTLASGGVNTVLLLSGSAAVAHAVHCARAGAPPAAARWLLGALATGLLFLALKGVELGGKFAAGIDLSTDTFWMFYLLLTGFHFLHVAVAVVLLGLLWWPTRQGRYGPHSPAGCHALETGAIFWHMVDLLWIVLFPLVYVAR